jgi:choline dehydrogenase
VPAVGSRGLANRLGEQADDVATLEPHMRHACHTIYPPTSTCRMGADAALVMPSVPRENTNAPAIAVGERAADLIRGRAELASGVTVGTEA